MYGRRRASKGGRWQTMDKSRTPLEKLALQWETFNRSDGKTLRTTEWHSQTLRLFLRYLQEQGYSALLRDVSLEIVREYILYLQHFS